MALFALETFTDNPIFTRELRRYMRGKVIIYLTNAFIGAMCLVTGFMLLGETVTGSTGQATSSRVGARLFEVLTMIQGLLVLCIAPLITAGMATAERERKTFEFLKVTTLSPFTFVVGGLMSTMLYVIIVLLCALPLISISFLYGSVSAAKVAEKFAILLGASLLLSAAGLWISSTRERTKSAQGATLFLIVGAILVGARYQAALFGSTGTTQPLMYFGAIPAPAWVVFAAMVLAVSGVLLMIASRKLYAPDNRPLAYRHSAAILVALCAGYLGAYWGAPTASNGWLWFAISYPIAFLVVVTHCLHQLEVGGEVWRLKKRIAPLRAVDESILFAIAYGAAWAAATVAWSARANQALVSGLPTLGGPGMPPMWLIFGAIAAGLVFCAMAARFWAHYCNTREDAFRKSVITALILFIPIPLAGWFLLYNTGDAHPIYAALVMVSPFGAIRCLEYADPQTTAIALSGNADLPASVAELGLVIAIAILVAATLALAAYHWNRFIRRAAPVDYSYSI